MRVQLSVEQMESLRQARRRLADMDDLIARCQRCKFPFEELFEIHRQLTEDLATIETEFGRRE